MSLQNHITRLENALGIKLYAVGGCVRDVILSRRVKDYDFTCKEKPEEIESAVTKMGKRAYTIGKRFGTIAFKDEQLGMVEITSFRGESYIPSSRKPTVDFVDKLEKDLSRRDFTMNALAMDSSGKIYDMFDGQEHLKFEIIKCVGDPMMRFDEDPLRILRLVRFAVEMEFDIDDAVKRVCPMMAHTLLKISKERIVTEVEKMFSVSICNSLQMLYDLRILPVLFPEVHLGTEEDFSSCLIQCEERDEDDKHTKGWAVILEYVSVAVAKHLVTGTQDAVRIREMVYKDVVTKYAVYLKFPNTRTASLLRWQIMA